MKPVKRIKRLRRYPRQVGINLSDDMFTDLLGCRQSDENVAETARRLLAVAIADEKAMKDPENATETGGL